MLAGITKKICLGEGTPGCCLATITLKKYYFSSFPISQNFPCRWKALAETHIQTNPPSMVYDLYYTENEILISGKLTADIQSLPSTQIKKENMLNY